MKMRVLIACEFSGIVRDEFAKRGHDAWSCDLIPSEREGKHIQGDVFNWLTGKPKFVEWETGEWHYGSGKNDPGCPAKDGKFIPNPEEPWDMMLFFWPCTWSTRSGARWLFAKPKKPNPKILYMEERRTAMIDMAHKFRRLLDYDKIPRRCGENPRPYKDALAIMGPWTQSVQPWMFGDGECKETCLWLRGLPKLEPTHRRDDLFALPEPIERRKTIHQMRPSPTRQQDRSRTWPGIAKAMAEQWG